MSAKESAAAIRKELKAHGWGPREVSVQTRYASLMSAIDAVIKTPDAPYETVLATVTAYEWIHRDATGEILGGGNTYTDVRYSPACRAILARRHIEALERAIAELDPNESYLKPIDGCPWVVVGNGQWPGTYELRFDSGLPVYVSQFNEVDSGALQLAFYGPQQRPKAHAELHCRQVAEA